MLPIADVVGNPLWVQAKITSRTPVTTLPSQPATSSKSPAVTVQLRLTLFMYAVCVCINIVCAALANRTGLKKTKDAENPMIDSQLPVIT